MKKLLLLSLMVIAGLAQARDIESYEASGHLDPATNSEAKICRYLAEEALKKYESYRTDDRITGWKACECAVNPPTRNDAGRYCRLGYVYTTDAPKSNGKVTIKNIVIPKF